MMKTIGLVVLLIAALWGGTALAQSSMTVEQLVPAQQVASATDACSQVDLPGCQKLPGTGYGYAIDYLHHQLPDFAVLMHKQAAAEAHLTQDLINDKSRWSPYWLRISRVSCSAFVGQVAQLHPSVAPLFEQCEGAATALATNPDFRTVACNDAMFTTDYMTLTDVTGSVFGVHHRPCYGGEQVVMYKGEVLFSLTCLNVDAPVKAQVPPPAVAAAPTPVPGCPNGYTLGFMAWDIPTLPKDLQDKAQAIVAEARARDTRQATDPRGYQGQDFSRTLGYRLRHEVKTPYPLNAVIEVNYRDPQTAAIVQRVGTVTVYAGEGELVLPDDPHHYIVEIILPDSMVTEAMSGGKRRIWDSPEEWDQPLVKQYCRQYVHGGGFFSAPAS